MELPAGGTFHSEIACDKGATTMFASSPGGDIQNGNNPCPGSPTAAFHANSKDDARGCALAIAYKSDVNDVKPEDFTIFSTNKTCVWYRFTDFQIPTDLPPCPEGGCICSFNWIHAPDSGSEQIFFNGYRCKVTNSNSNKKVAKPRVARRCGPNPDGVDFTPSPWNCTYGAKQAMYWIQNEGNTFFEGNHDPPYYNDFYNFPEGAQNDIFEDSQIPIFNDKGEHTGYTTLGGSTASIVFPTVSSWPTDRPDIPWGAVSFPSSSGSGSSGSGNSDSGNSTPPASSSPAPAPSSSPSPHGSIATNIAVDPIPADPSPTSSAVPTASAGSNSSDTSSTSTTTNTNSKWYANHQHPNKHKNNDKTNKLIITVPFSDITLSFPRPSP